MSHTEGPWELWTSNSWRRITSRATGSTVCEPVTQRDGHPDLFFRNGGAEGPDARLLIAAPDLLAACKAALGAFEHNNAIDWNDLERAIAKAEGNSEDSAR